MELYIIVILIGCVVGYVFTSIYIVLRRIELELMFFNEATAEIHKETHPQVLAVLIKRTERD